MKWAQQFEKERFTCCKDSIFELDYLPIILMSTAVQSPTINLVCGYRRNIICVDLWQKVFLNLLDVWNKFKKVQVIEFSIFCHWLMCHYSFGVNPKWKIFFWKNKHAMNIRMFLYVKRMKKKQRKVRVKAHFKAMVPSSFIR